MKVKHIVLAIAATLAAPSAFAVALDLTTESVPANNIYYVSGASAISPGFAKTVASFCNTGAIRTWTGPSGTDGYVYYCTNAKSTFSAQPGDTTGFTAGAKFIIVKLDSGGSLNGVGPVSATGSFASLRFPSLNCTATLPSTSNASIVAGTLEGTCPLAAAGATKPVIGLSDVPKAIWDARGQLPAADSASLVTKSGFAGQGFGIIVSAPLYLALQQDQGLTGTAQPSLSRAQYASLATSGNDAAVWDILLPNSAAAFIAGNPTPVPTFPPANTLTLARRVPTSGTQAASDVFFLNNPCNSGTKLGGSLVPSGIAGNAAGIVTFTDTAFYNNPVTTIIDSNSGTGDVKTDVGTATGYALGVTSLENTEASFLNGAKYVKIDGASPGVDTNLKSNAVNGTYQFVYEFELLTKTAPEARVTTLVNALAKKLGDGADLTNVAGVYADPNSGSTFLEGQTSHYTRFNNACAPLKWVK